MKQRKRKEINYPKSNCVYLLVDNGQIVYVGQSQGGCITSRLSAHGYTKKYDRVFYIECEDKKDMDRTEAELIIKEQPKYNRRIDDPSVIGCVGVTELKRMGLGYGNIAKIVSDNKIKTVSIGTNSYFEKRILEYLN